MVLLFSFFRCLKEFELNKGVCVLIINRDGGKERPLTKSCKINARNELEN